MKKEEKFLFDLQGYIIIRAALSKEEISRIRALADEKFPRRYPSREQISNNPILGEVTAHRPSRWGTETQALIDHSRLLPYLLELIGSSVRLDHDYGIFMAPGASRVGSNYLHGGPQTIDQGQWYRYHDGLMRNGLLVAAWFLTDAPAGAGGFCCIPGSHKSNVPLSAIPESVRELRTRAPYVVQPSVQAGDLVLFTEALIHGTFPWEAPYERQTLLFKYNAGHAAWSGDYYDLTRSEYATLTDSQKRFLEPPSVDKKTHLPDA